MQRCHTYKITVSNYSKSTSKSQSAKGDNSKKKMTFFFYFHQLIYLSPSISWPSLKLVAVIVFEIAWLQIFKVKICKGRYFEKIKYFFFNFHQLIYSSSSVSWPSLKLLAAIVFKISWLQFFKVQICKGIEKKNNFFLNFHHLIYSNFFFSIFTI